jgi:hypothetical protein
MPKQIAWSWTRLDCFEQCPRKFQGQFITKDFPKTDFDAPHFAKGKAVHGALEEHLKHGTEIPYPIPYKGELFYVKLDFLQPILNAAKKGEMHIEQQVCFDVDLNEVSWFDTKRAWVRAAFDLLVIYNDMAICLDWKTGKVKKFSDQLTLFAGVIFRQYPKVKKVLAAYVWCEHPNQAPVMKTYQRSDMINIWQDFGDRAEHIQMANESGNWPAKKNMFCKWCDALPSQCEYKE